MFQGGRCVRCVPELEQSKPRPRQMKRSSRTSEGGGGKVERILEYLSTSQRTSERVLKLYWAARRSLTLASAVRTSQYATAYPRRAPCTVYPSQNPYDAERVAREPNGLRPSKTSASPRFLWRMGNRRGHPLLGEWVYLSKEQGTRFFECEFSFHENVRIVQGYG